LGAGAVALMLVLLDSNIFLSALLVKHGLPAQIVRAWLDGRVMLLTCQHQIDEIREASRNVKFRKMLNPSLVGAMLNHVYGASVWRDAIPCKHEAADPTESFLLDLVAIAQPDYTATGDKRSGLLQMDSLGRTKFLSARAFCDQVLRI
jgi:putative PIN family toxin of toxin-antitoxin system